MQRTCPYCNTILPADATECPRCTAAPSGRADRGSARRSILMIAALGLLGVAVGFVYTWFWNGDNDPEQADGGGPSVELPAPDTWTSLHFLPNDTNAILATRPAAAWIRQGNDWENRVPAALRANIKSFSGLELQELEEAVVGLRIDEGLPRVTMILRAGEPFDVDLLEERAKGVSALEERKFYRFQMTAGPIREAFGWLPQPTVLIIGLERKDLLPIPSEPRDDIRHLSQSVRDLIEDKISDDAWAWVVADCDRWESNLLTRFVASELLPNLDVKGMKQLNRLAISIRSDEDTGPMLALWIQLDEAQAATQFREFLTARLEQMATPPMLGGAERWIFLRMPAEPKTVNNVLKGTTSP